MERASWRRACHVLPRVWKEWAGRLRCLRGSGARRSVGTGAFLVSLLPSSYLSASTVMVAMNA